MLNPQDTLLFCIQPLLEKIQQHPLFSAIQSPADLRRFSEMHVFAVWDFMCLIKALQRKLNGSQGAWFPPKNYIACRLLHEIILEEESDQAPDGSYISHFDWYIAAMQQCGANTEVITRFIQAVRSQLVSLEDLFENWSVPEPAVAFMRTTFRLIAQPVHVVASGFAYGRESITERMFTPILKQLAEQSSTTHIDLFIQYFQRHIDLDGGKHGQQSQTLVAHLCGEDAQKWKEATYAAITALKSRLQLLDGIYAYLQKG